MSTLTSKIGKVSLAAAAVAGTTLIGASAASANTVTSISPTSGGSSTGFQLTLPVGAKCSGDSTGNPAYQVGSYEVPISVDPTTVNYGSGSPSVGAGLFSSTQVAFQQQPTGVSTGTVPALPTFSWKFFTPAGNSGGDYGAGQDLGPGQYNIGIACFNTTTGAVDGNNFWNEVVTFTTSSSDAGGFTWTTVTNNPQTPETPFAVLLPLSALALLGGGAFVLRRRRRATAA
jgi:hypothetical protein